MRRMPTGGALAAMALAGALAPRDARAQAVEDLRRELDAMRQEMRALQHRVEQQDEIIRTLQARERPTSRGKGPQPPATAKAPTPPSTTAKGPATTAPDAAARALDAALAQSTPAGPPTAPGAPSAPSALARPAGAPSLRLIDVSVDTLLAAGTSTATDRQIERLEGGAHDPKRRGFTLEQAELSLAGAVDPYFTGQAHIVFTDSEVDLEEAFLTTQSLPYGLQARAGHFLTEFGRVNPTHPHAWQWIDQPVVNTRMFGGEGLRNPGARVGWLVPVPWFSQVSLGVQDAGGSTATSFDQSPDDPQTTIHGTPVGVGKRPIVDRSVANLGDLLYLTRWENGFDVGETIAGKVGASALFGPNASGSGGQTRIYGGDLVVKWRPTDNFRGWPFLVWETEAMGRTYEADATRAPAGPGTLPATTLDDWGLYTQLLYGFTYGWAAGVRYEWASGSGPSVGGREHDALRDDRQRVSPLLSFRPTEFSRLRLQYDFDQADHLPHHDAHSVWLGIEILYGQHPAHAF